jgi:hypothetical protein
VATLVPIIEVTYNADDLRIRRPDGEVDTAGALMVDQVGAQLVEQAVMGALGNKEIVKRA